MSRFDDCSTATQIGDKWRQIVRANHPDVIRTNQTFDFAKLNAERDKRLAEVAICTVCYGTRKIKHQIGFRFVEKDCPTCRL